MSLSDAWQSLQREIAELRALIPAAGVTAHSWATITSATPLRLRLDGASDPLDLTPQSLTGGHTVGQRVWVALYGRTARRVVILGASPTGWQPIPGATADFVPYAGAAQGAPQYVVLGGVTHIRGRLSPASASVASAITGLTEVGIATLPPGARPVAGVDETNTLCQGSGEAVWLLTVRPSGVVGASRYRGGTPTVNTWLPFHFAFPSQ